MKEEPLWQKQQQFNRINSKIKVQNNNPKNLNILNLNR